jgi:GT2 family glycosyltransferase
MSGAVPATSDGFLELAGPAAGGTVVIGWSRRRWGAADAAQVTLHSPAGQHTGPALAAWHDRADLKGEGSGFLLLLSEAMPAEPAWAEVALPGAEPVRLAAVRRFKTLAAEEMQVIARDLLGRSEPGPALARLRTGLGLAPLSVPGALPPMGVERFVPLGDGKALLVGWSLDATGAFPLRLSRGGASSAPLQARWLALPRPDIAAAFATRPALPARPGFIALAEGVAETSGEWRLEAMLPDGGRHAVALPEPAPPDIAAIQYILGAVPLAAGELPPAFDRVLGPGMALLNRVRLAAPHGHQEQRFGAVPEQPRCSIVVPLYGRLDFMAPQAALLMEGNGREDEILYVLDDPPRRDEALAMAEATHARWGVPFRLLLAERNGGFGPASNLGLAQARGGHVCFLNSDAFPAAADWLDHLLAALRDDPELGLVGALLLLPDGSVQHDGMAYEPDPALGGWAFPTHPGKGRRPETLPDALRLGPRRVPAVTGACMVLARPLAETLGGFDETYAVGDFEDADLCQRIAALGLGCAVVPRARLYHLERQSVGREAPLWRRNLTLFNAWTFRQRWPDLMAGG